MKSIYDIPSPAVTVNLDVAERNIKHAAELSQKYGIKFRPHMKVHKSAYFAKKQLEAGACGITCAKLSEAEAMADNDIGGILLAYPIYGEEKWKRYGVLNRKTDIMTTVDSLEVASGLNEEGKKGRPMRVLIEVDCGTHRCGVQPGKDFADFAAALQKMPGLNILGAFTYNGLIYSSKSMKELSGHAYSEHKVLLECANSLNELGIEPRVLSGGNSPDMHALDRLSGVTEIRPGNYLYNDVSAIKLGTAEENDCALRIIATVVSVPLKGFATIDAGSKTLTSDPCTGGSGFGQIIGAPGVDLVKLNEEHGYLRYDPSITELRVGERIFIIPNHACVISNLCDFIYGTRGDKVERQITIDARGKNY